MRRRNASGNNAATVARFSVAGEVAVQKISIAAQLIFPWTVTTWRMGNIEKHRYIYTEPISVSWGQIALVVCGAQSGLPSRCCRAARPPVSSGEREGEGLRARFRLRVMARAARAPAARERTACCSSAASVRSARASTRQRRARAWWGTASSTWLGAGAGLGVGLGLGLGSGI